MNSISFHICFVWVILATVCPQVYSQSCYYPNWVADGDCDEYNNYADCDYDGGDCCVSTCVDSTYTCGNSGYDCMDPAAPENCPGVGDGRCDPGNNNEVCGYDGGDCCEDACQSGQQYACGSHGYDCLCAYGGTGQLGDGVCLMSANTEICFWDLGDCCEQSSSSQTPSVYEDDDDTDAGLCCEDPEYIHNDAWTCSSSDDESINIGAIAGIVIGIVAFTVFAFLVWKSNKDVCTKGLSFGASGPMQNPHQPQLNNNAYVHQPSIVAMGSTTPTAPTATFGRVVTTDNSSAIPLASIAVNPGAGAPPSYSSVSGGGNHAEQVKQLNDLKSLHDQGVLTDAQYSAAVDQVISKHTATSF